MAEEKVLTKYCFQSIFKLKSNLEFVDDYNQNKRLKKLNDKTPVQYLKKRRKMKNKEIVFALALMLSPLSTLVFAEVEEGDILISARTNASYGKSTHKYKTIDYSLNSDSNKINLDITAIKNDKREFWDRINVNL
ncbi:hypothetical protein KKB54_00770 [bacterium]|nr:hypothetical protein [bacterium]MBU1153782.1 hypothetical protein [bacterium]